MAEIRWTREAENWLRDIHGYIALDDPLTANKVVGDIYEKAQVLAAFPEIGYKYRAEDSGDVRILLYGHYRIAYLIRGDGNIDILGVFHGALEINKYLP
jgi:plasmid stabilization system protein ParE